MNTFVDPVSLFACNVHGYAKEIFAEGEPVYACTLGASLASYVYVDLYVKNDTDVVFKFANTTLPDESEDILPTYLGKYKKGIYDLILDVNQNGVVDNADICNHESMGTYAFTVSITGDVNGDGVVNIIDVFLVAYSFGSTPIPFNPRWNTNADLNNDNIINIFDIFVVAKHFGATDC